MDAESRAFIASMRAYLIRRDAQGHPLREFAFNAWRQETVWPQAVNRWLAEIGARV
jgi:hypothetical protein